LENLLNSPANEMNQGYLANCWLISALHGLGLQDKLELLVIYANLKRGIYIFLIRDLDGRFKQVVVDDYLPCIKYKSKTGEVFWTPIYSHTTELDYVIISMLEKAIAKLRGSYGSMNGNTTGIGFIYLGAFPFAPYTVSDGFSDSEKLWHMLMKCFEESKKYALICGSKSRIDDVDRKGLVVSHAYSIVAVLKIPLSHDTEKIFSKYQGTDKSSELRLIVIRNPWGRFVFRGLYETNRPPYHYIAKILKIKSKIEHEDDEKGIFWMTYQEFLANMMQVLVVELTDDQVMEEIQREILNDPTKEDPAIAAAEALVEDIRTGLVKHGNLGITGRNIFNATTYIAQNRTRSKGYRYFERLNCVSLP
jgi:hypothetical protein